MGDEQEPWRRARGGGAYSSYEYGPARRGERGDSDPPDGDGPHRDRLVDPVGHLPRRTTSPPAHLGDRGRRRWAVPVLGALMLAGGAFTIYQVASTSDDGTDPDADALAPPAPTTTTETPTTTEPPGPASGFATPGLLTFRGSAARSYHGEGPVPTDPDVLWSYPGTPGGMCSESTVGGEKEMKFSTLPAARILPSAWAITSRTACGDRCR